MTDDIELTDAESVTHTYGILDKDAITQDEPGVFIFAQAMAHGWNPLYVGVCDSFRRHIPRHSRWKDAAKQGAATIFISVIGDAEERVRHHRSMVALLDPPLNAPKKNAKAV